MDATGIAASLSSSCLQHLSQGALGLRLIRHLLLLPPPRNVLAGTVLHPEGTCDPGSWRDAREGECSPELSRFGTGSFGCVAPLLPLAAESVQGQTVVGDMI